MKKILTVALAVLFAGNVMALENEPKAGLTYLVFAGFDAAKMKGYVSPVQDFNYDGKLGVNFGVKAEYVLPNAKGTYISAGVDWIHKGVKANLPHRPQYTSTNKIHGHYLEVPIHVGYRYNITKDWGVYGELGPYFAIGVTGRNKIKWDNDAYAADHDSHTMTFGKQELPVYSDVTTTDPTTGDAVTTREQTGTEKVRQLQRFDCGFGFRVGGEYHNQYSLTIGYDWGFTDAYTDKWRAAYEKTYGYSLPKAKNRSFTLTFGYRF